MNERLEIYKIFVETITSNEVRRQTSSTIYLGMLSAVATITPIKIWEYAYVPVTVALVISLTWLATVMYFRRLAQAKFSVIVEFEKDFCLPAFEREWQYLKQQKRAFFIDLTYLEMIIPTATSIVCIGYIMYYILSHIA